MPEPTTRLWTLQSREAWEELRRRGRLRARWRGVPSTWRPAYAWMAAQMVLRGVAARPVPPVWAWHSCGAVGRPPSALDVDLLWPEGRSGVRIELRAPARLVLLSDYTGWNDVLDRSWDALERGAPPKTAGWERIFEVDLGARPWRRSGERGDIQACLPYLDLAWVRGEPREVRARG
jgi:hypothetical protein